MVAYLPPPDPEAPKRHEGTPRRRRRSTLLTQNFHNKRWRRETDPAQPPDPPPKTPSPLWHLVQHDEREQSLYANIGKDFQNIEGLRIEALGLPQGTDLEGLRQKLAELFAGSHGTLFRWSMAGHAGQYLAWLPDACGAYKDALLDIRGFAAGDGGGLKLLKSCKSDQKRGLRPYEYKIIAPRGGSVVENGHGQRLLGYLDRKTRLFFFTEIITK